MRWFSMVDGFRQLTVRWRPAGGVVLLAASLALVGVPMPPSVAPTAQAAATCAAPKPLKFSVTRKITRSETGFTQGLEFRDGQLYESTGRIGGTTRLNVISLDGKVKTLADLGEAVFGEGLTILNGEVFQLTWQEHVVFVYDLNGGLLRRMSNPRLGWGLTNDGTQLIFSDGEGAIHFADPKTFAITKAVPVRTHRATGVRDLNELEYVRGRLYGNIFMTNQIVRLDPATGCIDAVADLGQLWSAMTPQERAQTSASQENVLNGIAYDAQADLFYLTGKRWQTIFVGRFSEGP